MKNNKKSTYLFIALFSISLAIVLYKVFHAICTNDEDFYIAETLRIFKGDRFLIDNWQPTQFYTLFQYPFLLLFKTFNISNDGIVLYVRLCFVILLVITSVLFYLTFKKYEYYSAIGAAMIMVYAPRGIRTLSYTTLSIIFLIICFCLYQYERKILKILAGLIYACCILCSPIFVLSFIVYVVFYVVNLKKKWIEIEKERILYFGLGIVITFVGWLYLVLSNSSLNEIMYNLQYCFDNRHSGPSTFMMHLINSCARFFVEYYLYIVLYIVLMVIIIKKNKYSYLLSIFVLLFGISVILIKRFQVTIGGYDLVLIPICGQGFITFYLTKKEYKNWNIFTGFMLSILLGIIYCAQSDGGIRTMCGPLILGVSISILMIKDYKNNSCMKLVRINNIELLIPVIIILFLYPYSLFFNLGGHNNNEYNTKFERGPHKGLYSNDVVVSGQYKLMDELYSLEQEYEGYLCYVGYDCWPYIYNNVDFVTFNTYNSTAYTKKEFVERTNIYFELHNDKRPILYYISKNNEIGIECDPAQFNGASMLKETPNACILKIE